MTFQTGKGLSAIAHTALLTLGGCKHQIQDPRTQPPLVALARVQPAEAAEFGFTGVVAARVQSDLGFRVAGKVIERLVDRGQVVHAGQALMRLDSTDFDNAVTVQTAAVAAAQANLIQAEADDKRNTSLVGSGAVSEQTYIDSKSAAAAARAQLDAAKAQLKITMDNRSYATLHADCDGVVADYLADPGQVVAAGQTVIVLAKAGPREAMVDLPEDVRPAIGSTAQAALFTDGTGQGPATLREVSDEADPVTRTFTARYVLQNSMAQAPLGATVTIYMSGASLPGTVQVPIAAVYDPGSGPGVWVYDNATSTVSFHPVSEAGVGDETITLNNGVAAGQLIVAMGANLLHQGEKVRLALDEGTATVNRFNLTSVAVRERSITLFFIIATILAGVFAYLNLGRAEDPPFTVKVLTVTAAWPGATAMEMQNLVADPLEKRMQELQWYDFVTTISRPGLMLMTVTLKDTTPPGDVPEEFYQARKKLGDQALTLPNGVVGPFINDEYSDVAFTVYALKAQGLPQRLLLPEAEILRERLLHVPGVEKVNILGERPEQIFVNISDQKLATLGLGANAIFKAMQDENDVVPEGSIDTLGPQLFIRVDRPYQELQAIRDTPIAANGHVFKLSDIATVERGYQDPPTYLIYNQAEPALELGVVMRQGWNGLDLGTALNAEQAGIGAIMPAGMSFTKVTDQSVNIRSAFDEFMQKFAEALGVVMIVCLVSLGWRVGIVVAAAVPLVLAAVFVIMLLTGREFDRITLGSLIISLGLLVDDAIITIEIMVVKLEEGWDRILAASHSWHQTAAPRLAGALITIVGFTPVGFARSTAGEYAGNIFWVVGFALLTSWLFAAVFTPYLGVKLLPKIKPVEGGHAAIYSTPRYNQLRRLITWAIRRKYLLAGMVLVSLMIAIFGIGFVKQQFFPSSDRPEVLVDVQLPEGTSIETTQQTVDKIEHWLLKQPEAQIVTSYIGQGAPRFFLAYNPELPDPSYAKIIVLTPTQDTRDALEWRIRQAVAHGLAPEARVRAAQLVFGPYSPYPVAFRVMGPDIDKVQSIVGQVEAVMRANPHVREVNTDWGQRQPTVHFTVDQSRLQQMGLTSEDVAEQLQFLLLGVPVTQVRSDIRTVEIVARSEGSTRLDPAKLGQFTLTTSTGKPIPLSQIGTISVDAEYPYTIRRDRIPTITVQSDIDAISQPPQVSTQVMQSLQPIIAKLPIGYQIQLAGSIEQAGKANNALAPIFPVMILLQLMILVIQVRSMSAMVMVFLTAPLGIIGAVPVLLLFNQPFGFNAILGLIALSGIIMRNTLILMGQIATNREEGLEPFNAVVEATVQRTRPVLLTALAAVLAFIPLTSSVFWGSMAYTLIGGTIGGTILIIIFLPALYAIWFKIVPTKAELLIHRSVEM